MAKVRIFLLFFLLLGSSRSLYGQETAEIIGDPAMTGAVGSSAIEMLASVDATRSAWEADRPVNIEEMADSARISALRSLAIRRAEVTRLLDRLRLVDDALARELEDAKARIKVADDERLAAEAALETFELNGGDAEYLQWQIDQLKDEDDFLKSALERASALKDTLGGVSSPEIRKIASELNGDSSTRLGFSDDRLDSITAAELIAAITSRIKTVGDELTKVNDQRAAQHAQIVGNVGRANTKLESAKLEVGQIRETMSRVAVASEELSGQLRSMDEVGSELLQTDLGDRAYTTTATLVFGGLVALVIAGFFWIAITTDGVSSAIFGGDRGIQFITLFSLVIAIILFGILGVLESKELSALLGGLSGYILGKSSVSPGSNGNPDSVPRKDPPSPVPPKDSPVPAPKNDAQSPAPAAGV